MSKYIQNRKNDLEESAKEIMPEIKISLWDTLKFILTGIFKDAQVALRQKVLFNELLSIIAFRVMQYYGAYKGNHFCRKLSHEAKMNYFYPKS